MTENPRGLGAQVAELLCAKLWGAPPTPLPAAPRLQPEKWAICKTKRRVDIAAAPVARPRQGLPSGSRREPPHNTSSSFPHCRSASRSQPGPWPGAGAHRAEPQGLLPAQGRFAQRVRSPSVLRGLGLPEMPRATAWRRGQGQGAQVGSVDTACPCPYREVLCRTQGQLETPGVLPMSCHCSCLMLPGFCFGPLGPPPKWGCSTANFIPLSRAQPLA